MQLRNDSSICYAQLHERLLQSRFGICNAVHRMRKWLSNAASFANQHHTAEGNLSCTAPKTWRLVLLDSQLEDYGVGTFLLRIVLEFRTNIFV